MTLETPPCYFLSLFYSMAAGYSTDKNAILSKYFIFSKFYDIIETEREGYTMPMKDRML